MRRRSFIGALLAGVAAALSGVSLAKPRDVVFIKGASVGLSTFLDEPSPNFRDDRLPRLEVIDRIPRPGGLDVVIFDDPDRLYRAPGDDTPVTRGGIVYAELEPGRWYACAIEERAGDQLFTRIMPVSWS